MRHLTATGWCWCGSIQGRLTRGNKVRVRLKSLFVNHVLCSGLGGACRCFELSNADSKFLVGSVCLASLISEELIKNTRPGRGGAK